ncbi:hypothetical protein AB0J35_57985 [Nonomuraea angiospora]|uniref:hypothetical protein n=1 Tax=Nonomuraea angiospora TaxID=46172 RepID=UPI0034482D68
MNEAFWIDKGNDRDFASDGVSRYGAYLRQHRAEFAEAIGESDRAEFAALAWRVATGPIMAPGYVRQAERVRSARLSRNYEDGGLYATVELVGITPRRMDYGSPMWREWPRANGHYYEPEGSDLVGARFLLTTTTAVFPLPTAQLPICSGLGTLEAAARRAVHFLVPLMNDTVTPLIRHLDREDS